MGCAERRTEARREGPRRRMVGRGRLGSAWPGLAVCLVLWLAAPALALDPADKGRFRKDADGVITDSQSKLQWHVSPKGGFDWPKARAWVEALAAAGGGWRMPTRAEMSTLATSEQNACFCDPLIQLSPAQCGWAWSGTSADKASAWNFGFKDGKENWLTHDDDRNLRAFAVRGRK